MLDETGDLIRVVVPYYGDDPSEREQSARLGVPEVWRYDGARLEILALEGDGYTTRPSSRALPAVTSDALTTLLPHSMGVGDIAWIRSVRAWARTLPAPSTP